MKSLIAALLTTLILSACHMAGRLDSSTMENARQDGVPIVFIRVHAGDPNSAGGVNAYIHFVNSSEKPIKYVNINAAPYNQVGDMVVSDIGRRGKRKLTATGPFAPGRGNGSLSGGTFWKNVWYNHTIRCIQVLSAEVEFMDGEKMTIDEDSIHMAIKPGVGNSCAR